MISAILSGVVAGLLSTGGLTVFGLLFRFAFMAPVANALPGVAKLLSAFAEFVLSLLSTALTWTIDGLRHICSSGKALFATGVLMALAGVYADRYDPVRSLLPTWLQSRPAVAPGPFKGKQPAKVAAKKTATPAKVTTKDRKPRDTVLCQLSPALCG